MYERIFKTLIIIIKLENHKIIVFFTHQRQGLTQQLLCAKPLGSTGMFIPTLLQ